MLYAPGVRGLFVQSAQYGDYGRRLGSLLVVRIDEHIPDNATAVNDVGGPQGRLAGIVTVVLGQIKAAFRLGK
jgi:hypothetical protein